MWHQWSLHRNQGSENVLLLVCTWHYEWGRCKTLKKWHRAISEWLPSSPLPLKSQFLAINHLMILHCSYALASLCCAYRHFPCMYFMRIIYQNSQCYLVIHNQPLAYVRSCCCWNNYCWNDYNLCNIKLASSVCDSSCTGSMCQFCNYQCRHTTW